MKNIWSLIIPALAVLLTAGCYQDDSTANYKIVNPINIVDEGGESLSVYPSDTLRINPISYKEGRSDSKLTFSWTLHNQNIVPTVLGESMTLKAKMDFQPMGAAYRLVYRVTDPESGLFVEKIYSVTVMSPFGTGLIVCDSRDGETSDVSLIMHRNFRTGYADETVMRNLFSMFNDRNIEGLVTGAVSTYYQNFATLTIATPKVVERVDPRDYSFIDRNGAIFYNDPGVYNIKAVLNDANSGYDIINNDGRIYVRSFQLGNRLFAYHFTMPDMSATDITMVHKPYWNAALCFDQLNGRFLSLNNSSNRFTVIPAHAMDTFPCTGWEDYECLAIFDGSTVGRYSRTHAVVKHKTTGRIQVLAFGNDTSSYPYKLFTYQTFDLAPEVCPEIDKAKFFCSTEAAQGIYYATGDKIYLVSTIVANDLRTTVEYTAPDGEEITFLYPWINYRASGTVDYTNPNPAAANPIVTAASRNRMLVVSTYNPSTREGFVNTVAIANMVSGTLEQNRELHKRFDGFGRISITTLQEK
jgi:hypothetical protein